MQLLNLLYATLSIYIFTKECKIIEYYRPRPQYQYDSSPIVEDPKLSPIKLQGGTHFELDLQSLLRQYPART
jgi:hypothetical protein